MRIVFTGGGTGGHVYPVIAVARQLKQVYNQGTLEMIFLGPAGIFKDDLAKEGIVVKSVLAGKLRRYFSLWTLVDILKIPLGLIQSFYYLYLYMPDVVFSKGGYGAIPVVLVSWFYFIPVLSHESDSVPGLANRIGGMFSKRVALSFQSAEKYFSKKKTALVGNPIRTEITQVCLSDDPEIKNKARNLFGLDGQKPVILVLGGSQGARKINQLVLSVLSRLLEKYEVIHQVGSNNYEMIKKELKQVPAGYHFFPFLDDNQYASAFLVCDLVVSRAGAGSISEIAACARPSILIPIPRSGADHQRKNAFAYAKAGATSVLEQSNLTPNLFLNEISEILDSPETSGEMKENAKSFSQPEAALKISQGLIEMVK